MRRRLSKDFMQAGKIKPGVAWTFRGGGILLSCKRQNLFDREVDVSRLQAIDDRRGETMPAGFTRRRETDNSVGFGAAGAEYVKARGKHRNDAVGKHCSGCRRADLIGDNAELFAFPSQTADGSQKVRTLRSVDPRGADNEKASRPRRE